jgi:predicted small lipoprotein YifL
MKNVLKSAACAVAVSVVAACAAAPTTLPPGEYKKSERSVTSDGTEYKKETTTNVYVDEYGNKRATQETETSKDPEGLFNKSTSTTKQTY